MPSLTRRPSRKVQAAIAGVLVLAGLAVWAYETGRVGSVPFRVSKIADLGSGCDSGIQHVRPPSNAAAPMRAISQGAIKFDWIECKNDQTAAAVAYLRFPTKEAATHASQVPVDTPTNLCVKDKWLLFNLGVSNFKHVCKRLGGSFQPAKLLSLSGLLGQALRDISEAHLPPARAKQVRQVESEAQDALSRRDYATALNLTVRAKELGHISVTGSTQQHLDSAASLLRKP